MTKWGQINNFFLKMILLMKNIPCSRTFRQIKPAIVCLESYTGKAGKTEQNNCTKFHIELYIPLYFQISLHWLYIHMYVYTDVCIHIIHTHSVCFKFYLVLEHNWHCKIFPTPAVKSDWGTAFSCYACTHWM